MKSKAIILVLVIVMLLSQIICLNASTNDDSFFSTGNDYIDMPDVIKIPYTMGMVDVLFPLLNSLKPTIYQEFKERAKSMTLEQFVKIYDKFLDENPELLHYRTGITFFYAIFDAIFPEEDYKDIMKFE